MITTEEGLVRVTVTLDAVDVDLLDRLAKLEGLNRSSELRSMLTQLRPILRQTVHAFESAVHARERLDEAAQTATLSEFEAIMPEVERIQNAYLGAMARLEGTAAAAAADPRPSDTGVTPPPPSLPDELESGSGQANS